MPSRAKKTKSKRKGRGGEGALLNNSNKVFHLPPIHRLIRDGTPGTLAKGLVDVGYGITFQLSSCIAASDISNLYDHYRLDKVEYYVELVTPNLSNLAYPRIVMAADWNNAVAPVSEAEVLEYRNASVYQFGPNRTVAKYTIVPRVSAEAYNSAVSTGYWTPDKPVFVDTGSSFLLHYGLRMFVSDYNTTISAVPVLRTYSRFYLSVKGTR
jgi:hypothetical protein